MTYHDDAHTLSSSEPEREYLVAEGSGQLPSRSNACGTINNHVLDASRPAVALYMIAGLMKPLGIIRRTNATLRAIIPLVKELPEGRNV